MNANSSTFQTIPQKCSSRSSRDIKRLRLEPMRNKERITPFEQRVYLLCSKVPKGKVTSYKHIAHAMGTQAYRAVGTALKNNPYAPEVPCHRVVASDGGLGGFRGSNNPSGPTLKIKAKMLAKEGITIQKGKIHNFEKVLHTFYRFDLSKIKLLTETVD